MPCARRHHWATQDLQNRGHSRWQALVLPCLEDKTRLGYQWSQMDAGGIQWGQGDESEPLQRAQVFHMVGQESPQGWEPGGWGLGGSLGWAPRHWA